MTNLNREPLQGAQLLYQNPEIIPPGVERRRTTICRDARFDFMDDFESLGGELVEETADFDREAFFAEPNHYSFEASGNRDDEVRERVATDSRFKVPKTVDFGRAEAEDSHLEVPYVLALMNKTAGYGKAGRGKYLIENFEQHERARVYADDQKYTMYGPYRPGDIEEREVIETPSDHYTSYRVVATAAGTLVAAGLLYSSHTKNDAKVVVSNRGELETDHSETYLASRDIRSNLSCGGNIIPLMGDDRAPVNEEAHDILDAHGIDPYQPELPESIREQASQIAVNHARPTGLFFGFDFMGDGYFIESNSGYTLGLNTYSACRFGRVHNTLRYDHLYQQILAGMVQTNMESQNTLSPL
jgi:hypothetical protein